MLRALSAELSDPDAAPRQVATPATARSSTSRSAPARSSARCSGAVATRTRSRRGRRTAARRPRPARPRRRSSPTAPRSDRCTCPDAGGGLMCKHAIATLLVFADEVAIEPELLARWRRATRSTTASAATAPGDSAGRARVDRRLPPPPVDPRRRRAAALLEPPAGQRLTDRPRSSPLPKRRGIPDRLVADVLDDADPRLPGALGRNRPQRWQAPARQSRSRNWAVRRRRRPPGAAARGRGAGVARPRRWPAGTVGLRLLELVARRAFSASSAMTRLMPRGSCPPRRAARCAAAPRVGVAVAAVAALGAGRLARGRAARRSAASAGASRPARRRPR